MQGRICNCLLYTSVAFDSNVTTVDALQSGAMDALVVQNTYAMGYFGVESAYKPVSYTHLAFTS